MNRQWKHALLASGFLAGSLLPPVAAAADAIVEGVHRAAWVERYGARQTLTSGLVLQNHDRVMTGPEGRALIRLGDGSMVRLASETRLELNALGVREADVFTAALDVRQGAVRFSAPAGSRQARAVNLRVGSVTASIRGTDLWGRTDPEGDRICLFEGHITVSRPDEEARPISEALTCYLAPKGGAASAIETIPAGRLAGWAAATELASAAPAPPRIADRPWRAGSWAVELATVDSEAAALSLYDRARAAGYPVRIRPLPAVAGGHHYTLRLGRLPTQAAAAALAEQMAQSLQIALPVVVRQ